METIKHLIETYSASDLNELVDIRQREYTKTMDDSLEARRLLEQAEVAKHLMKMGYQVGDFITLPANHGHRRNTTHLQIQEGFESGSAVKCVVVNRDGKPGRRTLPLPLWELERTFKTPTNETEI